MHSNDQIKIFNYTKVYDHNHNKWIFNGCHPLYMYTFLFLYILCPQEVPTIIKRLKYSHYIHYTPYIYNHMIVHLIYKHKDMF